SGDLAVAGHASAEGTHGPPQVQPGDDLQQLLVRIGCSDEQPVGEGTVLQELPVPCQENATLPYGNRDQFGVVPSSRVVGVEAQQPEIAGQFSKVTVGDEPDRSERSEPPLVTVAISKVSKTGNAAILAPSATRWSNETG